MEENCLEKRLIERFTSFQRALYRLTEAKKEIDDYENQKESIQMMMRDSAIQRFEITFELSWKLLKDYEEYIGYTDIKSPNSAIRRALQIEIITNPIWLEMLKSRNTSSHVYDKDQSIEIIEQINTYHQLFIDLEKQINSQLEQK
ncbi:MAG: nucleotidyltransferase substrate binding protein [Alphaproteobacteria bacterium]|nr:nucleotidyltransferase substrate binding protein [Alphaproteobacteria bacterium]